MAINLDRRIIYQTQLSGLKQVDASPFVAAGQGFAQFGKDVQDFGTAVGNFAIRERKVFNATQINATDAQRTLQFSKLKNKLLEPENFNPHSFEADLTSGLEAINKTLAGSAPKNSRLSRIIAANGETFSASQAGTIGKEARVYRTKALKAQGLESVRVLRQEELALPNTPSNALLKQSIDQTMMNIFDDMGASGLLDPDEVIAEKNAIIQDRERTILRQKLETAETIEEYEEEIAKTIMIDGEDKEFFEDKFRVRLRERERFKLAKEEHEYKMGNRDRDERILKNEADILARLNDPDVSKRPDDAELDRLLRADLIGKAEFKAAQTYILNPPTATVETNPAEFQRILDEIDKPEDERAITAGDIKGSKVISSGDANFLVGQLRSKVNGQESKEITASRRIMKDVIGTPETFIAFEKPMLLAETKVLWREYHDRIQAGEDPIEVANSITDKWRHAMDVTSGVSQNRVNRQIKKLPEQYRKLSANSDGLNIPDTAAIQDQALKDYESGDIKADLFNDIIKQSEAIEEVWTKKLQEKHGGRKTSSTLKRERLERKKLKEIEEEAEAKKLEAEENSFANKATESIKGAASNVKESVEKFVNRPPDAPLDTRDTGDSRERAEQIQAKEREERKRGREVLQEFANKPADEILKDVENLTIPVLQKLQQALSSINISGSPEAPVDNRDSGDSRERAEKLQAKERKERQASKRDKKSKEAAPAKSFVPESSADVFNSLPGNIENISLEKLKSYARAKGNKLRRSERKKLTALLKKKGVTGNALKKLEEQISLGLTKDN